MVKMKYRTAEGEVELEVSEEFKKQYEEIDRESNRNDWKFDWRARKKNVSIEQVLDEGKELTSENSDAMTMEEAIVYGQRELVIEDIKRILKTDLFTQSQKELIEMKFYKEMSNAEIGKILNIDRTSVRSRLETIYRHFKKIIHEDEEFLKNFKESL